MLSKVPANQVAAYLATIREAQELALDGAVAYGFLVLVAGLSMAQELEATQPWASEMERRYCLCLDNYLRCFCRPFLAPPRRPWWRFWPL